MQVFLIVKYPTLLLRLKGRSSPFNLSLFGSFNNCVGNNFSAVLCLVATLQ